MIYVTIKGRNFHFACCWWLEFLFWLSFAALLDFAAAAVNVTLALVGLKARHCLVHTSRVCLYINMDACVCAGQRHRQVSFTCHNTSASRSARSCSSSPLSSSSLTYCGPIQHRIEETRGGESDEMGNERHSAQERPQKLETGLLSPSVMRHSRLDYGQQLPNSETRLCRGKNIYYLAALTLFCCTHGCPVLWKSERLLKPSHLFPWRVQKKYERRVFPILISR